MRLEDAKCGKCYRPYHIPKGCTVCEPAKDAMLKPEEDFEDTSLSAAIRQQLRIMRTVADQIENELHSKRHKDRHRVDNATHSPHRGKDRYYRDVGRDAMAMSKSFAAFMDAIRKWEGQQANRVADMSLPEKLELILGMLEDMPTDLKQRALLGVQRLLPETVEDAEVVDD